MITIYRTIDNRLETLNEVVDGAWINVIDPTSDEIEQLSFLGIPQDFITYPLDLDERARTEREDDGTLLIIIRIPFYQGQKVDVPYITIPLGVIVTQNLVITICRRQNDIIQDLASGRIRGFSTAKRNRFILRLLLSTATRFLTYLREINRTVEALEDSIQVSQQNKDMFELLKYQKSLVYFATALKTNELMLERLRRSQIFHQYPDDEDLLEDVITENQQAIEMVNISANILTSMADAFASIISNNLNVVMKFLASITIVMSIPTIVTSFYGMNVALPFQNTSWAPAFVVLVSVFLMALVIMVFSRRNWF
ncbi:MAG TPA: magnesium transporter CorA family protein [Chloroflexi bacterium]|nr:magnesium transporter CorA family protein [Chloroflexota bacterium]HPO58142.1 magnesium transporter CorA family protein [Anaerolineaceae bacterium]